MLRLWGLFLFILFCSTWVKAQRDTVRVFYEVLGIAPEDLAEEDFERLDYWQEYIVHPLDLNTLSLSQLQSLPFLEDGEAELIWQYRERYQSFASVYDLAWLEGLPKARARFLAAFFCVGTPPPHKALSLLQQVGYRDKPHAKKKALGVPLFRETRFTYTSSLSLRLGVRGRNIAGEPFGSSYNRFGYANYSGYAEYTSSGRQPLRIVVGNYVFRVGYGLIFSASRMGFPAERIASLCGEKELPRGTFATTSSATPLGIAINTRFVEHLSVTLSTSYRPVNATYTMQGGERYLRTVDIAGAFDTEARQKWRNVAREATTLLDLKYTAPRFKLGIAGVYDSFNTPFLPAQRQPNNSATELKSRAMVRLGFYGMYRWHNARIWSEGVYTRVNEHSYGRGAYTALFAGEYKTGRWGSCAVELYYYGLGNVARYQQNYSRAPHPRDRAGANLYYTHWLRGEVRLMLIYRFNTWRELLWAFPRDHEVVCTTELPTWHEQKLMVRYKYRYKEGRSRAQKGESELHNFRHDAQLRYTIPFGALSVVSQLQLVLANQKSSRRLARLGGAFFQDLRYTHRFFSSSVRLAYFSLSGSNAALYFGEPALPYTFPLHSARNSGVRFAVLLVTKPVQWLRLGLQIGSTFENGNAALQYSGSEARMQCNLLF